LAAIMEAFPNQEGSVSRLTTLATVMHAGLPKTLSSSGYKSQKKNRTRGTEKEGGGEVTVRRREEEKTKREQTERRRGYSEEKARRRRIKKNVRNKREQRNIEKAKRRAEEAN